MRVTFDPDASDDLDRVLAWIAKDGPRAAFEMVARIEAKIMRLATRGRGGDRTTNGPLRYTDIMTRGDVKEILNRVLDWPVDDQAKLVRYVRELERWRDDEAIFDEVHEQAESGSGAYERSR